REEARENHRNAACRHHPVQPVLVAAGRGALLVERLSVALQPLSPPLLAHPVLSILLSAALLRLLPAGLLLPVLAVLRLLILPATRGRPSCTAASRRGAAAPPRSLLPEEPGRPTIALPASADPRGGCAARQKGGRMRRLQGRRWRLAFIASLF